MKKIVLVFAFLTSLTSFALADFHNNNEQCKNEEQATKNATKEQLAQQVLCCCPIRNGGQCCNYQPVCIRLVDGCICSNNGVQSEPVDSKAKSGKVQI